MASFSANIGDDYILVSLDFPNGDEAKAAIENPERNNELMVKYRVSGFPTVLLMTPDGVVFGRSGYTGATPEDYLDDVLKQRDEGKAALVKVQALRAELDSTDDKMAVIQKAIDMLLNLGVAPGGEILADILHQGFVFDPEDKGGLKATSLMALLKSGVQSDADLAMATASDPSNESGLLEYVVYAAMGALNSPDDLEAFLVQTDGLYATQEIHDKEMVRTLWVNSAYFCHQYLERPADAKTWAQRAKDLGDLGDSEEIIEEILNAEDPS